MRATSDQNKLVQWLNTLVVMAQWDKMLPFYFVRLFDSGNYETALQHIRAEAMAPTESPLPAPPGNMLDLGEWERVFRVTRRAESLRKLFANNGDPFAGARADEISVLAEVSDLTTDSQATFYSQNGTFQLVHEVVRQRPELDTVGLITDGLHKFYTLLDTNATVAEELYKLASSNDWYPVLASLYDARDYTAERSPTAKQSLDQWNRNLTAELRSIILKPTKLYRVPKRLIKLAWERKELFVIARATVASGPGIGVDLRQQVANVAYPIFVESAPEEIDAINADLQLLAAIARHYTGARKFAKLDGLVYAWPRIANLAMANYPNLEYVEDLLVNRKPRPTEEELNARDACELYEMCENNSALIRFLRLKPYFKEIDEDELRRYRPLAPVTISDPAQQAQPTIIQPPVASVGATTYPPAPVITTPTRVCELQIRSVDISDKDFVLEEVDYDIYFSVSGTEVARGRTKFSIRHLFDLTLAQIGVTSEDSLQPVVKSLFSGEGAEYVLVRGGLQLFNTIIGQAGLTDAMANAFSGDGPVRLIIATEVEELQYLPWEWLPRPGYSELILADARFSVVRSLMLRPNLPPVTFNSPIRIMGIFPNTPVGARDIAKSSLKAWQVLATEGAHYTSLTQDTANLIRITEELNRLYPQIVHFEGYVQYDPGNAPNAAIWLLLSGAQGSTEPIHLTQFKHMLVPARVHLFVLGRNESSRAFGNAGAVMSYQLTKAGFPAVIAPIRSVDDVTATSLTTEFYRAFLAGNTLEQALYIARRKVASRGGDWTSFALFADPATLDLYRPLPPTP